MARDNVELVRRLSFGPKVDIALLIRDKQTATTVLDSVARFFHPEFECVVVQAGSVSSSYRGLDGLRVGLLDWLAPWASYRSEVDELIDTGDTVLVLDRDHGRLQGSDREVEQLGATVWKFRDGQVARIELYPKRAVALEALGLKA